MKRLFICLLVCLFMCGCSNSKMDEINNILDNEDYVILDVRTKEEYNNGHIKDALNIPYDEITEDINIEKDKYILVYCKSGVRSKIAYDSLTDFGYNVYDMGEYDQIDLEKE